MTLLPSATDGACCVLGSWGSSLLFEDSIQYQLKLRPNQGNMEWG